MCAVPLRSSDRLQLSSSPESILAQQTHPIFARFSLTWTCSKTYLKSPSCEAQHVLLARTLASVAFVFWSCSRGPSQESHPGLSDPPRLYHQQPEHVKSESQSEADKHPVRGFSCQAERPPSASRPPSSAFPRATLQASRPLLSSESDQLSTGFRRGRTSSTGPCDTDS